MLKDVVEHCKASSKTEESYQAFKKYILTSSPSRTLYVLEVCTYLYIHVLYRARARASEGLGLILLSTLLWRV